METRPAQQDVSHRRSPGRRIPRWVAAADVLALLLVVLAVAVFLAGGWRANVAGIRFSLRSGWRPLAWAAIVVIARHVWFRRPSLVKRLLAPIAQPPIGAAALGGAVRAACRGGVRMAVLLVRAPIEELSGFRGGLAECARLAHDSRLAIGVAVLLAAARGIVFAWWPQAAFNSDHAIVGLMAKHLAEGRAFPLFFYGQSYMLGVEAWLAFSLFLLAGPSVFALELPLVAVNAVVAALLVVLLRKELDLGAGTAFTASLVFLLAPPATALALVEANGGSVEPLLYVLLLWVLRDRPALFGLALGFGFLHREFTIYGLLALLVLRVAACRRPGRQSLRHATLVAVWFCVVWGGVQALKPWSSPFGPGTSLNTSMLPTTNLGELARRFCWSPAAWPSRFSELVEGHLPVLLGTAPRSLARLGIASRTAGQGAQGMTLAMGIVLVVAVGRIWARRSRWHLQGRPPSFAVYLVLVGWVSMAAYAAVGCGKLSTETLRYDLLGLLAVVGLAALFFRLETRRAWKAAAVIVLAAWATASALSHGRLLAEYLAAAPRDPGRDSAERLLASGVRGARASYWIAYRLTFLTSERLVVSADDSMRIAEYQAPARESGVVIRSNACQGGEPLALPFYRCPQ